MQWYTKSLYHGNTSVNLTCYSHCLSYETNEIGGHREFFIPHTLSNVLCPGSVQLDNVWCWSDSPKFMERHAYLLAPSAITIMITIYSYQTWGLKKDPKLYETFAVSHSCQVYILLWGMSLVFLTIHMPSLLWLADLLGSCSRGTKYVYLSKLSSLSGVVL